jgi:hypothetical protein
MVEGNRRRAVKRKPSTREDTRSPAVHGQKHDDLEPKTSFVNWRAATEQVPFIDCAAAGIPEEIFHKAVRFAAKICATDGRDLKTNFLGIIDRYLRDWELKQFRDVMSNRLASQNLTKERSLRSDISEVRNHATGKQHRPEEKGFEFDHEGRNDAERWRRFHIKKTLRDLLE